MNALLVLSGGMDSTSMLYAYRDDIRLAVNFHYGSNHNDRERDSARYHCGKLGIELVEIDLDFMTRYFNSSLLSGADAIPEGSYDSENIRSTVVPFRNGIMLSIAAGLAESRGLDTVMLANHAGDHAIYPDCTPAFAEAMDKAIEAGTYPGIRLYTPFTHLTKAEIARKGADAGLDPCQTYSCYKGGEIHCGRCATCVERHEAILAAGLPDTTPYQSTELLTK